MSVYDTYGLERGANQGNPLSVTVGTLDLATLIMQAPLLAAQSGSLTASAVAYTALSGSIVSAITLGHTVSAGDVTLVGSLTTSASGIAAEGTAIAAESAAITGAVGTVNSDIFLAVNTGSGCNQMDVRMAMDTIELYLLSGAPLGSTTNFPPE